MGVQARLEQPSFAYISRHQVVGLRPFHWMYDNEFEREALKEVIPAALEAQKPQGLCFVSGVRLL